MIEAFILKDNDEEYLAWIKTIVEYSCPNSDVVLTRGLSGYHVHITPCNEQFRKGIIKNVLNIHHRFDLKIEYSKSLKISKRVSFFLPFEI